MSNKRSLSIFGAAVCLVALCAGAAFAAGVQDTPTMEAKEVTLRIFARAYTWEQEAPWEVAKAEIQKRHPDTKFTWVEEGFGWADLRSKFLASEGNYLLMAFTKQPKQMIVELKKLDGRVLDRNVFEGERQSR